MENICQKFAEKENKSVNTFLFLYEGNIVNLELNVQWKIDDLNYVKRGKSIYIIFLIHQTKDKLSSYKICIKMKIS